jgi:hypothetical protein
MERSMRTLMIEELVSVSGGEGGGEPPPAVRGDNGWGNGAEGINNGSDEGGTTDSKIDELWTASDGPAPDKFTTR